MKNKLKTLALIITGLAVGVTIRRVKRKKKYKTGLVITPNHFIYQKDGRIILTPHKTKKIEE